MQTMLCCAAIFFALVKVAPTHWYVTRPGAHAATATARGRVLYVTGKLSPALAIAALLAHAWLHGASAAESVLLGAMLVRGAGHARACARRLIRGRPRPAPRPLALSRRSALVQRRLRAGMTRSARPMATAGKATWRPRTP